MTSHSTTPAMRTPGVTLPRAAPPSLPGKTTQLPPPTMDPPHAAHSNWKVLFCGYLCSKDGYYVAEPREKRDKDGDVEMTIVGHNKPFISQKYLRPILEINTIPCDGNCFFASVASVVYGTSHVWLQVKAQLQVFVERVLSDKQNQRYTAYKAWFDYVADPTPAQKHLTNGLRLSGRNQFQSATAAQVAADMYRVMFVILVRTEGDQETAPWGVKMRPLKVAALYGHPEDPVRLLHYDPELRHFMGVRPTKNAEEGFQEYALPPSLLSSPRPWKAFQVGEESPSGVTGRLCMGPPDLSEEDIQRADGGSKSAGMFGKGNAAATLAGARPSTSAAAASKSTTSTTVQCTVNQIAPLVPSPQRSITDWRHPNPPHKFWDVTCSLTARQDDKRRDKANLDILNNATIQDVVESIQELEMLSMEEGYAFNKFTDKLRVILRKAGRLTGGTGDDSNFADFAKVISPRTRRLRKGGYLDSTSIGRFTNAVEYETRQVKGEKVDTQLRLGLYLLVRFHLHHTGTILAGDSLSQQLKELHSKI